MEIQDRISKIIDDYFEGNLNRACRAFGIAQSSMINIVKGKRNKPSYDNILKILSNKHVNVNANWLFFGVGNVLNTDSNLVIGNPHDLNQIDYKEKYDAAIHEIVRLQSKLNELYEMQMKTKEFSPIAMGDVKVARSV